MLRSPLFEKGPIPNKHGPEDRLPIEFFDFEKRLNGSELYSQYAGECEFLHENGYVILKEAVDPGLCDELSNFYSKIHKSQENEQIYCEYYTTDGERKYGIPYDGKTADLSDRRFKFLDLFQSSRPAIEAALSPRIENFLSLIFQAKVLAFQQLGFIYGTEQPIHQDTAYVRVSKPAMLAASWIALEDIKEGTGELEFIPGSHKYDSFRFNSPNDRWCRLVETDPQKSIWWNNQDNEEHNSFLNRLAHLKQEFGCDKFINAAKGDALIWISYFAHGGSAIDKTHANFTQTRKSLVTHYCPYPDTWPMYMHEVAHYLPRQHSTLSYYTSKRYPLESLPEDFCSTDYLELNPDISEVKRFAEDPGLHYILHGSKEKRQYRKS
jgi:phytanoyl-CoA hydroxylase